MLGPNAWKLAYLAKQETAFTPPLYVNVEPTNWCNLHCTICSMDASRPKGYMDLGLFREVVGQAKEAGVAEISLWLSGEPLLHKQLGEMVRYVTEQGLVSNIHTNATLMTEARAEELIDAGLTHISFSFDGETKEEYEAIRVGGRFDRVLNRILGFLEVKRRKGSTFPHAILQVIKPFREEYLDRYGFIHYPEVGEPFKQRFEGLPLDEFRVILPHTWGGELTDIGQKPPGKTYYPCHHLWMGLSIAWDGRVLQCCTDLNGRVVRGDVRKTPIKELWNNDLTRYLRRKMIRGEFRDLKLCKDCDQVWHDEHPLKAELRKYPVAYPLRLAYRAYKKVKYRD